MTESAILIIKSVEGQL